MYYYMIPFIFIIICLIVYIIFNKKTTFENFSEPNIEFAIQKYMKTIIDDSNYFNRMTKSDLLARNIGSLDAYKKLYYKSLREFNDDEKTLLYDLVKKIDDYTIDSCRKLNDIPWKFVKTSFNIENNFPHTHGDVIVLSHNFLSDKSSTSILKTLLHEKIHVYQRLYPLETNKLITDYWNFKVTKKFSDFELIRNNPDINNFVYSKNDVFFYQKYTSKNPSNISESIPVAIIDGSEQELNQKIISKMEIPIIINQFEHPYEIMASLIPVIIIDNYKDNTFITKKTIEWINKYLL